MMSFLYMFGLSLKWLGGVAALDAEKTRSNLPEKHSILTLNMLSAGALTSHALETVCRSSQLACMRRKY